MKLLKGNSNERLSAEEALDHPWFHNPEGEEILLEEAQELMSIRKLSKCGSTPGDIGNTPLNSVQPLVISKNSTFSQALSCLAANPDFLRRTEKVVIESNPILAEAQEVSSVESSGEEAENAEKTLNFDGNVYKGQVN